MPEEQLQTGRPLQGQAEAQGKEQTEEAVQAAYEAGSRQHWGDIYWGSKGRKIYHKQPVQDKDRLSWYDTRLAALNVALDALQIPMPQISRLTIHPPDSPDLSSSMETLRGSAPASSAPLNI